MSPIVYSISVTGQARSFGESMIARNRLDPQDFRLGLRTAAALRLKTVLIAAVGRSFVAPDGALVLSPGRKPWTLPHRPMRPTGYTLFDHTQHTHYRIIPIFTITG